MDIRPAGPLMTLDQAQQVLEALDWPPMNPVQLAERFNLTLVAGRSALAAVHSMEDMALAAWYGGEEDIRRWGEVVSQAYQRAEVRAAARAKAAEAATQTDAKLEPLLEPLAEPMRKFAETLGTAMVEALTEAGFTIATPGGAA